MRLIGYVNGEEIIFDYFPPNLFKATIPKRTDGKYIISLVLIDNAENINTLTDTFLYIDFKNMKFELIDRKYKEQLLESDKNIIEITTEYTTKELINYSYKPLENQYIYRKLVV